MSFRRRLRLPSPLRPGRFLALLGGLALAGSLLAPAPDLAAQNPPALGADGVVAGEVRLAPSIGAVRGSGMPFLRATAAIHVSPWLSFGGEAAVPMGEVRTTAETSPDRSELTLRYGGIRVGVRRPSLGEADPWALSFLLGTGTARVTSSLLNTELGADNFLIFEPAVERRVSTVGPVELRGAAAYRIPIGAEPLPGVRPSQLRGVSITLSLSLRKNP
ncbi:MAG: hypothetical protein EA351_05880 [Gemmatimonadales bacterium]|nr:MAG: hypothetical protein EA351_05880 [Gemmatimonadales bacterium]